MYSEHVIRPRRATSAMIPFTSQAYHRAGLSRRRGQQPTGPSGRGAIIGTMPEPAEPARLPRSRARRLLLACVAALLAILVLVAGGAVWLLRTEAGHRRILDRVVLAAGEAGVELRVDDLTLELRRGRIELRRLAIGMPGMPPLLRADALILEADLASLTSRHLLIRELRLVRPVLNPKAPPPRLRPAGGQAGPGRTITVQRFVISDGVVRSLPLPPDLASFASAVAASGIEIEGSFVEDTIDANLRVADVAVERPGVPAVHLAGRAAVQASITGEFSLRDLAISADGLTVTGAASGHTQPALELHGNVTADLDARQLLPDLAGGGRIHLSAEGSLPGPAGEATLTAGDLHLDDLQRFFPRVDLDRFDLGGCGADLQVHIKVEAGKLMQPAADGAATLRRGDEVLATASVEVAPDPEAGPVGIRVAFRAEVLPALPGRRTASGTVVAAASRDLVGGRLRDAEAHLGVPDLVALHGELARRFPNLVPALPEGLSLAGALEATVTAEGPLLSPHTTIGAAWLPAAGGRVELSADGQPAALAGRATLTLTAVPAALIRLGATGVLAGTARAEGSPRAFEAQASLQGRDLALSTGSPRVDTLRLEASTDGRELVIGALEAKVGPRRLSAHGRSSLRLPIADATLDAELEEPATGVRAATVHLALRRGELAVELPHGETAAGPVAARLEVPLGALARVPRLADLMRGAPLVMVDGPVHLQLWAPGVDTCDIQQAMGLPERPERATFGLATEVWIDPADLTGLTGSLEIGGLRLSTGSGDAATLDAVRLDAFAHRIELQPAALLEAGTRFETSGEISLQPGWQPGSDALASLVPDLRLRADGQIPSELLGPYLFGGVARGNLLLQARASGPPTALRAAARLEGPDVSLFWPTPYSTRIEAPSADFLFANGELAVENGLLHLNGGEVQLSGKRYADGFLEMHSSFARLSYRLDYGVMARLSGNLDFALDPAARGLLAGEVVLDRGLLTRDLDLEREVLPRFLAPVQTTGTGAHVLDTIDMDVTLATVDGLRVTNNLADLRATWKPLSITGTVWNPAIKGDIEVEPGGKVFAYGQTILLDRAVATFTGDPVNDPRLDLSTSRELTNANGVLGGSSSLDELQAASTGSGGLQGLAGYFGERLTKGVGEKLGLSQVSIRQVLVFGETDPSARLTLTREFSRHVLMSASVDLRSSQRQTYLLDLHGFRKLPRFVVQGFSNDDNHQGATIQQVLELGGSRGKPVTGPEVDRIVVEGGGKAVTRIARRAVRVARGAPLPEDSLFDIEVEVMQALRDGGYPDAGATVSTRPAPKHPEHVELVVTLAPGPRVLVKFEGDRPPSVTRRSIAGLYRVDAYEAVSREEMRVAAVRALRSEGFLDPRVQVTVLPGEPRTVAVTSIGGARVGIDEVAFSGLPPEETVLLARRFAGPTERTELAAGLPDATRRVEESLRALGYPNGRLVAQQLSRDGKRMEVELAPGTQDRLASVDVEGVDASVLESVTARLPVRAGSPARQDLVAEGAFQIEVALQELGYTDVRVRTVRSTTAPGVEAVRYVARAGRPERLAAIQITGQRASREGWLQRAIGLQPGEALDHQRLVEARNRLLRTNLFASVTTSTAIRPDGGADVTFTLQEKPRFSIAYGARWESAVGWSGVVDFVDRNLLGRALVAGVRARWEPNDRSGRLYLAAPQLLGGGSNVETFAESRRTLKDGLITDTTTATLQLSRPLGRALRAQLYGRYSDVHVSEEVPDPFFPFDLRIRHPYLGAQLLRDTREDPVLGIRGMFASLDVSGSGPFLGSDFKYLRGYAQVNTYLPVGRVAGVSLNWAQSVRAGLARAFDGQELLFDVRFRSGGEYSVRGYPFESLGPQEYLGNTVTAVGGAAELVVNEELRFPMIWDLSGVVFVDAGQVWARSSDFGRDLATAVGLGLRAETPVGVLRLDLARPLDRRPGDPSFKLYLGLGNAF